MTGSLVRLVQVLASRDRLARSIIVAGLVAVMAGALPGAAADETIAPSPGAPLAEARVPYEYSTSLIQWDAVDGTYRSGEEEGSFAFLVSLPEATGWEFVTILAESWTETTVDDQAAWDVFRWRAVYRRPFEFSAEPAE
jgi:hypothetical protein